MIFIVTDVYPDKVNIYKGRFVEEQAILLRELGYEVVVISLNSISFKSVRIPEIRIRKLNKNRIDIIQSEYFAFLSTRFPKMNFVFYSKKIKKLLTKAINIYGRPQLFICHFSLFSGFSISKMYKQFSIPYIVIEHHSIFLRKKLKKFIVDAISQTIRNSQAFFAVSKELKESIESLTLIYNRIVVLPNIVNEFYGYEPKVQNAKCVFFSAGNLVSNKGFIELLDVFDSVIKLYNQECKLFIAGDGPLRKRLERIIIKKKLENDVKLLGKLSIDKMREFYKKSDVFILLSKYETFGITYREAMIMGRPVISLSNKSIMEFWEDGFGLLIKDHEIQKYVNAVIYMIKNHNKYNGVDISVKNRNMYSKQNYINILERGLKSNEIFDSNNKT